MKRFFSLWIVALLAIATVQAQEANLRLHLDFANASGKNVADTETGSGVTAKILSAAKLDRVGEYGIVDLGNGTGYVDLTRTTGAIAATLEDFTLSLYYRVDEAASLTGAGYFLWAFSQLASNGADSGPYSAYRLNVQRMATSPGGYAHEVGMEIGSEAPKGRWTHYLYRQRGTTGQVYLNGRLVLSKSGMPVLKEIFKSTPTCCWLGRAPFSGDNYLKQTQICDFRLYDTAIGDADIILYVTDTVEKGDKNEAYIAKLQKLDCPVILVINKIDISTQEKVVELMAWWKGQLPKAEIIPASAQEKFNLESILEAVSSRLPEAPAWFDKDQFTDKNLRFFASEILREKIFLNYSEEIPYSCQVEIEAFHEGEDRYEISAVIYVMRESQKGILIGKGGRMLKKVGTEARADMEDFFQKKVFLSTFVKVDPDWRESRKELRRFGYEF